MRCVINPSQIGIALRKAVPDAGAPAPTATERPSEMSYAAPFYYAAKAIQADEPVRHPHQAIQRRRRIRLVLFPAQRPQRRQATVAAATSGDC
jgi:hypothetical protein